MKRVFSSVGAWWQRQKCQYDVHDYRDGTDVRTPHHFYTYTCRHCGRKFEI